MEAHYLIRIVFWNISVVYKTKENFIYVTFLFIVILVIFKLFELCGFCRATTRASKKKKTRARFALHKTFTNKLQPRLPKKKRAHTVSARDRGPRILVKSIPLRKSFFWMHKKKLKFGQNRPKCSWIFLVHQQKSVTPFHNKIMVHSWILKKYCRPKPYPLFPDITVWSWKMENVPLFLSGTKELSFFGSLTYPPLSRYSCKFIKS